MDRTIDKYPLAIFLIWLVFFFLPIGNRGLWNPDEPRYLQVAWEMAKAKSYLVPIFNGEFYAHKPPLFFWLTILMSKISAFETASRYVSALMSLGTICLTYLLGKRYGDRNIGFMAALILMTSGLFLWLTGTGNIDTTLTFLTTLSFFCFMHYEESGRWQWILPVYISCGIGILTKGPVGFLIPWVVFLVWTIFKRYFKKEKVAYIHLIWGPLVAVGISFLWVIPACLTGGEAYAKDILITHNIGRTVDSFAHQAPWYYYVLNAPGIFMPWTLVFLATFLGLKKNLRDNKSQAYFYLGWLLVTFLFFSLFSGKRAQYLLPAFPAFSLYLANAISRWEEKEMISMAVKVCIFLMLGCGIVLFLFPPIYMIFIRHTELLSDISLLTSGWHLWALYGFGILPLILLWASYKKIKQKKNLAASVSLALTILMYLGIAQLLVAPALDPVKSIEYLADDINKIMPKGTTLAFYKKRSQRGLNFYLKRPVIPVVSAKELKNSHSPYDYILKERRNKGREPIQLEDVPSIKISDHQTYEAIYVKKIGSKEYTLWKLVNT